MHDIRRCNVEHLFHIGKASSYVEALGELPGHQWLAVADRYYGAIGNPMYCLYVLIRDLSATH